MIASVSFKGISRRGLVRYLNIVSHHYDSYNSGKIRDWQINHQLEKILALSKNMENRKELLETIQYLEKRIKASYPDNPIDEDILAKTFKVIHQVNEKLGGTVSKKEEKHTTGLNSLIRESQMKKIKMIEERYNQLKQNPYSNPEQLEGIRKTLERLRSQMN